MAFKNKQIKLRHFKVQSFNFHLPVYRNAKIQVAFSDRKRRRTPKNRSGWRPAQQKRKTFSLRIPTHYSGVT